MTLNIKEIQEQGGRLGDVLPRIELVRQLSNSLIMAKNNGADTAISVSYTHLTLPTSDLV